MNYDTGGVYSTFPAIRLDKGSRISRQSVYMTFSIMSYHMNRLSLQMMHYSVLLFSIDTLGHFLKMEGRCEIVTFTSSGITLTAVALLQQQHEY